MTNHECLQRFQNLVDVAAACNSQLHDQAIVNIATECFQAGAACNDDLAAEEKKTVQTTSAAPCLATMSFHQSDRRQHGKLSEDLENSFTKGNDDCPKNIMSTYHLINEHKNCAPKSSAPGSSGVALAQKTEKGRGNSSKNKDNSWQTKATCHHCGEIGCIRPNCPNLKDNDDKAKDADKTDAPEDSKSADKKKENTTFAQLKTEIDSEGESENKFTNFGFCNTSNSMNLRNTILLDNQSAVNLFCNLNLVS
jgi:hypothetical protein